MTLEQRERVECVYKVCKGLTSPFRPFNIPPNPERALMRGLTFCFLHL